VIRAALEEQLAVNLYCTLAVTNAFLPQLIESQGTIINNVSMMAFAPVPLVPSYSISKAAPFNMTQSLRGLFAAKGVRVHAMLGGPRHRAHATAIARCGTYPGRGRGAASLKVRMAMLLLRSLTPGSASRVSMSRRS
jgi:short-subunit dehydrogenase